MSMLREPDLISDYKKFALLKSKALDTGHMDLSDDRWFYPTYLLPIGVFRRKHPEIRVSQPKNEDVCSYFDIRSCTFLTE